MGGFVGCTGVESRPTYCLRPSVFVDGGWVDGGEGGLVVDRGDGNGCGVGGGAEGCATAIGSGVPSPTISTRRLIPGAEGDSVGNGAVVVGSGWSEVNTGIGIGGE